MESRQYCGNRKNCLRMMQNTCSKADASYQTLHDTVQQTLQQTMDTGSQACFKTASLCPSLPYVTAYVNPQDYTGLVSQEMALKRGSAFNNLYWPYNERRHS